MNIKYLLIISLLATNQFATCSDQEIKNQPEELANQNEKFIAWSITNQKPLVEFYNSLHENDPKIPQLQDIVRSNLEYHGEYDIVWPKLFDHATYIALNKDAYDLHNPDLYIYDHANFKPVVPDYEFVLNQEGNDHEIDSINLNKDELIRYNYIIENYNYLIKGFQLVSDDKHNIKNSFEYFLKKALTTEYVDIEEIIDTAQKYIAERMKREFLIVLDHAIENNIPLFRIHSPIFLYVVSHQHDFMKFFICTWIKDTYHLDEGFGLVHQSEHDLTFTDFENLLSSQEFNIIVGTQKSQEYIATKMKPNFLAVAQRIINLRGYGLSISYDKQKKDPVFSYIMTMQKVFMKKFINSWIDEKSDIKKYVTPQVYDKIIKTNDSDALLLLLYLKDNYANDFPQEQLNFSKYLITASYDGSLDIVTILLDQKNININEQDNNGVTPLLAAVQSENVEVVSLLLSVPGIDTEIANRNNFTPLCLAIQKNNPAMVKLLLQAGARHDVIINNRTLLDIAIQRGLTEIVELLTQAQTHA